LGANYRNDIWRERRRNAQQTTKNNKVTIRKQKRQFASNNEAGLAADKEYTTDRKIISING
jgi:hypothetical protein